MTTTTVSFQHVHGQVYIVKFRYAPALVDVLKLTVPAYSRAWKPDSKQWVIDGYARDLARAMRELGCTIIGFNTEPAAAVAPRADWATELFRAVGPDRTPAVHRALSRVLHPDNGDTGCPTLQRQLNDARTALENTA
jgi:hypothetical protein